MKITVEFSHEDDGRWIAEIPEMPGVMVYGKTEDEAILRLRMLAQHVFEGMLDEAIEKAKSP